MEIVRIIDRAPTNFKKIISGASASFEKDKVLMYFLHGIVDREEPTLSNQQMEEAGRLEKQFGCLKGNDTNKISKINLNRDVNKKFVYLSLNHVIVCI
jgi:hypothetical protein